MSMGSVELDAALDRLKSLDAVNYQEITA